MLTGETISISLVISIVSMIIVIWNFAKSSRKDTRNEVEEESAKMDGIKESLLKANMKLDQVCATTNETRTDIKGMNSKIAELDKELGIVKRDLVTAFHRIDELRTQKAVEE